MCMPASNVANYSINDLQSMGCLAFSLSLKDLQQVNMAVFCNTTISLSSSCTTSSDMV